MSTTDPGRLRVARDDYDEAVRAERLAAIAAAGRLRLRARRRRAAARLTAVTAVIGAVILLAVTGWALASRSAAQDGLRERDVARAAAAHAVTEMLTADPAHADDYLPRIRGLTTGEQRERLDQAGPQLRAAVAGLGAPSTGRVISAGAQPADRGKVGVVVVAQASAPQLVGGAPGTDRVAVHLTMVRSGDRWLVAATEKIA
ncbi:hypothetical protein [Gordonia sp. (in: high G+C Gram-positive bacteria)]|uniref:hypothetical protein n=1 Tax=Gordonia sp. (in: high G+C Gram-positive bacteria) TaxID=84139 RepID=UPI003527C7E9